VTKEFAFDQVGRDGSHVDRDEWLPGPWGIVVNRLRDEFLSGSTLSGYQYHDVALLDLLDEAKDAHHGTAVAEYGVILIPVDDQVFQAFILLTKAYGLHEVADGILQVDDRIVVLDDVIDRALTVGLNDHIQFVLAGNHDAMDVSIVIFNLRHQLQSVHAGKQVVDGDDIRVEVELLQALFRGQEMRDIDIVHLLQRLFDQVPDELIVFNYEYAGDRHGVNSVL